MSSKSKRSRHPRRGPRPHETAKLDQSLAALRDFSAQTGIPGAVRAAANGEKCSWCDCPMDAHIAQVVKLIRQGADPLDTNDFAAALKADGADYCGGCGNKALSVWIFTDQQVRYPICEHHDDAFRAEMARRYGGRTMVVPQRIYDRDII